MSVFSRSAPKRALQALSVAFGVVAIASGWAITAGLEGSAFYTAVGLLVTLELGAMVGAGLLFSTLSRRQWYVAAAAFVLFAVCAANTAQNGLMYSWGAHAIQQAKRADAFARYSSERRNADAAVDRAELALAAYDSVRATATIDQDIAQCEKVGCRTSKNRALASEKESADARDALTVTRDAALKRRSDVVAVPNELSPVAAFMSTAFGFDPARVDLIAAALRVALFVLAAPLCAGLAQLAAGSNGAQRTPSSNITLPGGTLDAKTPMHERVQTGHVTAQTSVPQVASKPSRTGVRASLAVVRRTQDALVDGVLDAVRSAGGVLDTSMTGLARMLDASRSSVHVAVRAAADAGALVVQPSSSGTVLRLA